MRGSVCLLVGLLVCSVPGAAQEYASVSRSGQEVTLTADSWDPVLAIGRTLADRLGIRLSVEAPKWAFSNDSEDVAVAHPAFSALHPNAHYRVMKRHVVQVRFLVSKSGLPNDVPGLLRKIADAANREMPYAYRLDSSGDDYALVPTRTRNSNGVLEEAPPLLDRPVTIPAGTRSIAEDADLMAEQLGQLSGLHVSCCQSMATPIPWGLAKVAFGADDKPARDVLKSLMLLERQANSEAPDRHSDYDHWSVSCDGTGVPWCFIEVEWAVLPPPADNSDGHFSPSRDLTAASAYPHSFR
jgi:hypothetical protein